VGHRLKELGESAPDEFRDIKSKTEEKKKPVVPERFGMLADQGGHVLGMDFPTSFPGAPSSSRTATGGGGEVCACHRCREEGRRAPGHERSSKRRVRFPSARRDCPRRGYAHLPASVGFRFKRPGIVLGIGLRREHLGNSTGRNGGHNGSLGFLGAIETKSCKLVPRPQKKGLAAEAE